MPSAPPPLRRPGPGRGRNPPEWADREFLPIVPGKVHAKNPDSPRVPARAAGLGGSDGPYMPHGAPALHLNSEQNVTLRAGFLKQHSERTGSRVPMELHYHSKLREVPLPFLVLLLSLPGCQCLCVLRAHASGQPTPAWDLWPVILPEIRPQIHGLVAYGTHAALEGPISPFLRPSRSFSTHFLTNLGPMVKFLRMI